MALHSELPIYKDSYQLMKLAVELTSNFRRDFKNTIGQKLRDECVEMGLLILRANTAQGAAKIPHIDSLLERVELTHLMLRLSVDMQLISRQQYSSAVEITGRIGKQAGGWKKFAASPATSSPRRRGQCE